MKNIQSQTRATVGELLILHAAMEAARPKECDDDEMDRLTLKIMDVEALILEAPVTNEADVVAKISFLAWAIAIPDGIHGLEDKLLLRISEDLKQLRRREMMTLLKVAA